LPAPGAGSASASPVDITKKTVRKSDVPTMPQARPAMTPDGRFRQHVPVAMMFSPLKPCLTAMPVLGCSHHIAESASTPQIHSKQDTDSRS
jgi:hypothetical protein